jgi:hypothetical protein
VRRHLQYRRDDVQRRNQAALADANLDAGLGVEAFGAAHVATSVHVDDGFLVRVDADAAQPQDARIACVLVISGHGLPRP